MYNKKEPLFSDFPSVSTQEWMDKITADLKGADFTKKLVWKTNEGFPVQPFYRAEDIENLATTGVLPGEFPYVRGTKPDNNWFVRQDIPIDGDVKKANAKALDAIEGGATSLGFCLQKEQINSDLIAVLLNGIQANSIELNFRTCIDASASLVSLLVCYFKTQGYADKMDKLQGSIDFDPITRILLKGRDYDKDAIAVKAKATVEAAAGLSGYRIVGVGAAVLNNAGAYITQELGYALAWGVEYLNLLIDADVDAAEAAQRIRFNFGVGGNYFLEIAKFRAAR
ncbi:MAG: methylmalonyl-CoA mutase family protein, partial [Bacteroidales bacterium]|nr:methylmalonyl-CoA mutase family protein [Bacteroidales bacterium]